MGNQADAADEIGQLADTTPTPPQNSVAEPTDTGGQTTPPNMTVTDSDGNTVRLNEDGQGPRLPVSLNRKF